MSLERSLLEKVKEIQDDSTLHDFGGGSPLNKCYIMAYLASTLQMKNYVEIGVYRGRSLFSIAKAFQENNGKVYGIDPYELEEAKQYDMDEEFRDTVNDFLDHLDLEEIYKNVILKREILGLTNIVEIIRRTSSQAVDIFKQIEIDMLHIDGNHDYKHVHEDITNYAPLLKDGGIIVFDDINWDSVRRCYDEIKKDYIILLETEYYGVLLKKEMKQKNLDLAEVLTKKLGNLYNKLIGLESQTENTKPTVYVGVLAYNHEKYILQCLKSIINQKGNFNLKVIISEDKSTDRTAELIESFIKYTMVPLEISFEYLKSEENLGMVKNLKRLLDACKGSDYTALIDGDDYWADDNKIQNHLDFLNRYPECALSFDSIMMYYEDQDKYELFSLQQEAKNTIFTTTDIIKSYVIGNISCCFYDGKYLDQIPDQLFEMFVGDWMLNIVYSQFGDIGFIKKPMTVYRKHNQGIWSGVDEFEKRKTLLKSIDNYNRFLNYTYDEEFSIARILPTVKMGDKYLESYDLVIIDDVFPHPVSGFRYQEFISYFENYKSMKVLTTGWSVHVLGKQTVDELIINFKRKFPQVGSKLEKFSSLENIDCKLLYFVFLGNAYSLVELAEARRIPFVFELYPGGLLGLNNSSSDNKLRRVMSSPCFRKVIVTQKNVYDYLIEKKFCKPEQIEYIFGVVTPIEKVERNYNGKRHFGIDKECLDICFVAHKYTKYGQDKGYDVFIDVAKKLAKKYNNIKFHVVGNFNEEVIDITEIKDRVHYYGIQQPEWFDEFYKDKDIILSANIPGMIYKGSFDGFPTASCTDASLCKTAIFCTDPLQLNHSQFKNNDEIVIIEHDALEIVNKIEYYFNNPELLKEICENGFKAIRKLYGYESQIAPRINLLKEEFSKPLIYDEQDFIKIYKTPLRQKIYLKLKKKCPQPVKDVIKRILNQ